MRYCRTFDVDGIKVNVQFANKKAADNADVEAVTKEMLAFIEYARNKHKKAEEK